MNMAVLVASSMLRAHAPHVGDGHNGGTLQLSDCSEDLDVRNLSIDSLLGLFVRQLQACGCCEPQQFSLSLLISCL